MNKIIIGVYSDSDPRYISGEDRLKYALEEAKENNINLVFFSNDDIIFSENMLRGQYWTGKDWKYIKTYIPEVIINPIPNSMEERSRIENKLREIAIFTSYGVMGKHSLYKKLIESEKYSKYAIKSREVTSYRDIEDYLSIYDKVVFKPIDGRQGIGIYFIYRQGQDLMVLDNQKKTRFKQEHFKMFIDETISNGRHIVQPYIESKTKKGEPYDFRIHIHRDVEGEWAVVKSYPRIGSKKGLLSNISRGGRTLDIDEFLKDEFGSKATKIREELEKLAMELGDFVNNFSEGIINEIGVDLAIDRSGNYYTYELNGGPQSKYHERERAKYVIEYALYLYKKYLREEGEKALKYIGGQFLQLETRLFSRNFSNEKYIGVLTYIGDSINLNIALGYRAMEKDINLYYFYPEDINYEEKYIYGRYYLGSNLKRKIFPYPHVVIDRLRARGFLGYEELYKELDKSIFTIDRPGGPAEKSYGFSLIKNEELKNHLIPYVKIKDWKEFFNFIDKHKIVITKPNDGMQGSGIAFITFKDGKFEFRTNRERYLLNKIDLKEKLEALYLSEKFIVQKYIESTYRDGRPFDNRVHMAKGKEGKWQLVNSYFRIGGKNKLTSNLGSGGYMLDAITFLENKFGERAGKIYEKIMEVSHGLNQEIEKNIDGSIAEIAYDFAITNKGNIYIFEINLNKSDPTLYEYALSEPLIDYANYLLDQVE